MKQPTKKKLFKKIGQNLKKVLAEKTPIISEIVAIQKAKKEANDTPAGKINWIYTIISLGIGGVILFVLYNGGKISYDQFMELFDKLF